MAAGRKVSKSGTEELVEFRLYLHEEDRGFSDLCGFEIAAKKGRACPDDDWRLARRARQLYA